MTNPGLTTVTHAQKERFLAQICPAAGAICPHFGLDPKACVTEAAEATLFGSVAIGFNWWNLPAGLGDAGYFGAMMAVATGQAAGGGYAPQGGYLAKFSSPAAAVTAWCKNQEASHVAH